MSLKHSTNFKKDYITVVVVILFVFTIASEVFLAVFIPLKLRDSSLWDKEASMQLLVRRVDGVRRGYTRVKSNDIIVQSQANLGSEFMMIITAYIRQYRSLLSLDEIHKINLMVGRFESDLKNFQNGKIYGQKHDIKVDAFVKEKVTQLAKINVGYKPVEKAEINKK